MTEIKFEDLLGKILKSVKINENHDTIDFITTDGEKYIMYHDQDCCETVNLEDVCGNMSDLIDSPLVQAEEVCKGIEPPGWRPNDWVESYTWTFYKLATTKGSVTLKWYGESNGYYSERVSFYKE